LETPIGDTDVNATKKAKILYLSCIDEETIEKRAEKPLLKLLDEEFGGWPLLRNNSHNKEYVSAVAMDWVKIIVLTLQILIFILILFNSKE
jgi:hypothetical protein